MPRRCEGRLYCEQASECRVCKASVGCRSKSHRLDTVGNGDAELLNALGVDGTNVDELADFGPRWHVLWRLRKLKMAGQIVVIRDGRHIRYARTRT